MPINSPALLSLRSQISRSISPLRHAEQLIGTLPGVISARIVASPGGAVEAIHMLTSDTIARKGTVRNVKSALMVQLGMRVNHRKITVARLRTPALGTAAVAEAVSAAELRRQRLYFEGVEFRHSPKIGAPTRATSA